MKYSNKLKEIRNIYGLTLNQVVLIMGKKCVDILSEWEQGINKLSTINLKLLRNIWKHNLKKVVSRKLISTIKDRSLPFVKNQNYKIDLLEVYNLRKTIFPIS